MILLVGLMYPVGQAASYVARFSLDIPEGAKYSDVAFGLVLFYVLGCLAAWILLSSLQRQWRRKAWVGISYAPFLFVSFVASVLGGLLGPVGVLAFGLAPLFFPWLLWRLYPSFAIPDPKARRQDKSDGG